MYICQISKLYSIWFFKKSEKEKSKDLNFKWSYYHAMLYELKNWELNELAADCLEELSKTENLIKIWQPARAAKAAFSQLIFSNCFLGRTKWFLKVDRKQRS